MAIISYANQNVKILIGKQLEQYKDLVAKINTEFAGTSPGVFIGRYNYPNVNIGILAPPQIREDAWILDAPEFWYEQKFSIPNVMGARSQLVHSRTTSSVKTFSGKIIEAMQEIAAASKPVDTEFILEKKPSLKVDADGYVAPLGAHAPLKKALFCENPGIEARIQKVLDDDLLAKDSLALLYQKGTGISRLSNILSTGLLGRKKKLVPTRWSITAVDDTLSKNLIENIKYNKIVDKYLVYSNEYLGNHFEIMLIPHCWSFEVVEWSYPFAQFWHDYEDHNGRKSYADSVTGAYYSDRLAVAEYLTKIRKQASVLILREVMPSYNIPCGVWVNREAVRGALEKKPSVHETQESALNEVFSRMKMDRKKVLQNSELLHIARVQMNLQRFL